MSAFHFKQFDVQHSKGFKVGTDGVLLGAWAQPGDAKRILDIGTGTGLLALMCAQKNPEAFIDAIDIDRDSCEEAKKNFEHSPWANKMSVQFTNLVKFSHAHPSEYDFIICNPPYFSDSTPSPNTSKAVARHGIHFSLQDLAESVVELLTSDGKFALILPDHVQVKFEGYAEDNALFCFRKLKAYNKEGKEKAFILSEWTFEEGEAIGETLNIRNAEGEYSTEHLKLTEAFYLDRE